MHPAGLTIYGLALSSLLGVFSVGDAGAQGSSSSDAQRQGPSASESGPGRSYQMPLGKDTTDPAGRREEAPYPRSPIGDAELRRLKDKAGGGGESSQSGKDVIDADPNRK